MVLMLRVFFSVYVHTFLKDINLTTGEIIVLGKGSKQRIVLIGNMALNSLKIYLDLVRPKLYDPLKSGEAVFLNKFG